MIDAFRERRERERENGRNPAAAGSLKINLPSRSPLIFGNGEKNSPQTYENSSLRERTSIERGDTRYEHATDGHGRHVARQAVEPLFLEILISRMDIDFAVNSLYCLTIFMEEIFWMRGGGEENRIFVTVKSFPSPPPSSSEQIDNTRIRASERFSLFEAKFHFRPSSVCLP